MRLRRAKIFLRGLLKTRVYCGKHPSRVPSNALILFPCTDTMACCGLAGIVCFIRKPKSDAGLRLSELENLLSQIKAHDYAECMEKNLPVKTGYLGGASLPDKLLEHIRKLKTNTAFLKICGDLKLQQTIQHIASQIRELFRAEYETLQQHLGLLSSGDVETFSDRIEKLRDAAWCLETELIENIAKINTIGSPGEAPLPPLALTTLKNINAVLNSIDRLEVRGRDSAGISLLFTFDKAVFEEFQKRITESGLADEYRHRLNPIILQNRSLSLGNPSCSASKGQISIAVTYKIASEVGRLGDNIRFIRNQMQEDRILRLLIVLPHTYHTVTAHTRWASVGEINEANCHPHDPKTSLPASEGDEIIHVCLNGDIDNFQSLKKSHEDNGICIPEEITCDTKIIPIHIKSYIRQGFSVSEAFRLAVNDFEGSHAISMHSDLAPGKIFLALQGSGQAIFIGLAEDHYICASELYGLVEETSRYIKLDGGARHSDPSGGVRRGQIFILDQSSGGKIDGLRAMFYDGTPINLAESSVRTTPLTSGDIDRRSFDHYFLKEISESPASVKKTLQNRWQIIQSGGERYSVSLDSSVIPEDLASALKGGKIKKIIFIGQGTAGVAALACAFILRYYLKDTGIQIESLKSSELSAAVPDRGETMDDTLLIPISQSGTIDGIGQFHQ